MKVLLVTLFLLFSVFGNQLSPNAYTGFRFTVQKGILEATHLENFKAMTEQMTGLTWPDLKHSVGSGFFSIVFKITNLKTTGGEYDFSKNTAHDMIIGDNRTIQIHQTGPVLTLTFGFDYDFALLGMHLFRGHGTAQLTSNKLALAEVFKTRGIDSLFMAEWAIKSSVSGLNLFGGMTRWVDYLFNEQQLVKVDKQIEAIMEDTMVEKLTKWTDFKVEFYSSGALTMLLKNNLVTMNESSEGYLSLGYQTDIFVEDRPLAKKTWRYVNTPVNTNGEKVQFCVSTSLIPNMVEMQNKAKDFMYRLEGKDIGLSGKIKDLAPIMPKIYEHFDPELDMYIGCRPTPGYDIVRIASPPHTDRVQVQVPINCVFGVVESSTNLLSVNFYVRGNITKEYTLSLDYVSLHGRYKAPWIYYLKVAFSKYPVEAMDMVYVIMGKITRLLNAFPIIAPGLTIKADIGATKGTYTPGVEEDCFSFTQSSQPSHHFMR
eukprot:TRINITY_DN105685_c1_g1_i1.p1 TRINITY_DN105685_c1_g1~~TRINITY_DN105685_c1_g1_i1.p1  ORF type:complete len:486 (+),score=32.27 TRINITY_DN105685_c1_g1_i1:181-1638(+)